jgi:hypothetical protein
MINHGKRGKAAQNKGSQTLVRLIGTKPRERNAFNVVAFQQLDDRLAA